MKTRKSLMKILGVAMVMMIVGFIAHPAPAQAPKPIELKFTFPYPEPDEMVVGLKYMVQELEKRTGGRVKITMYYSESLGKLIDSLDMLNKGVADIAFFSPSMFAKVFRIPDAITLPSVRVSNRPLATEIMYSLYYQGLMNKDYAGYKPLLWQGTTPAGFAFRKKINTLEELRKLKIRAPAGLTTRIVESLGVSVVSLLPPEVYMAVQKGVVDGVWTMPGSYFSLKLPEVTKYWLWLPMGCGCNVSMMTQAKWDSLPPDIQMIWERINYETKYYFLKAMAERPSDRQRFKDAGVEVYSLSPKEEERWYKIFDNATEKWVGDVEAAGYPAKAAVNEMNRIINTYTEK